MGELNRGLENLEAPERKTDWYFLRRAKSTAKTRRGLRPSGLPGTIQSSAGNTFGEVSSGTSRTRFFAQNGGEKALNRCEVRVLQREELELTSKEQPYSLQTVGYGWVRMGCGGQKRTAFSVHARPTDKEQPFLSAAKLQLPTAPKLTCNSPFRIPLATVSLQYNIPFSRLRNLAFDVWLPFRTDSNPHRRYPERLSYPARPVT